MATHYLLFVHFVVKEVLPLMDRTSDELCNRRCGNMISDESIFVLVLLIVALKGVSGRGEGGVLVCYLSVVLTIVHY